MGKNNLRTSVNQVTIGFFFQQLDQIIELYFEKL